MTQRAAGPGRISSRVPVVLATVLGGLAGLSPLTSAEAATAPPAWIASTVASVPLRPTEAGAGYQVRLMLGGGALRGHSTLSACGYRFRSESHRVVRRQVEIVTSKGMRTRWTNEVVGYDSVASATQAMKEWKASLVTCATAKLTDCAGKRITVRTMQRTTPVRGLPIHASLLTYQSFTPANAAPSYKFAILQQRGRVLDIVWVTLSHPARTIDRANAVAIAKLTGQRLVKARTT